MKNGESHERHLALCANFEKGVENFSAEGRVASTVTSYIEKRNAVDGDSVEHSFSISIDKVWLSIFTEISGATLEVHLKERL